MGEPQLEFTGIRLSHRVNHRPPPTAAVRAAIDSVDISNWEVLAENMSIPYPENQYILTMPRRGTLHITVSRDANGNTLWMSRNGKQIWAISNWTPVSYCASFSTPVLKDDIIVFSQNSVSTGTVWRIEAGIGW